MMKTLEEKQPFDVNFDKVQGAQTVKKISKRNKER